MAEQKTIKYLVVGNQISVQCWDFYVDVCRLWYLTISKSRVNLKK